MKVKVKTNLRTKPYRFIPFGEVSISTTVNENGDILLKSDVPLQSHPKKMTERLVQWSEERPFKTFLAERDAQGEWREFSYLETYQKVRSIAQFLLDNDVSVNRPIAILSENSVEHGMLALAALHTGIPYSAIAPAYSLKSDDFIKLRYVLDSLTPGLIFVKDGSRYEKALEAVAGDATIVVVSNPPKNLKYQLFEDIVKTEPTKEVDFAYQHITEDTIAKILFTSGSTGMPKGVINTHRNICTNWQQITQTFPFMKDDFVIIDWLPWNHTFGGNHNFGLTLYNGGSMYIDGGNPTSAGIKTTVKNLQDISPTVYFNVPKGYSELYRYLKRDRALREKFFSKLKLIFYAGASLPQHLWNDLEQLALDTVGERIIISTGLGCTESSPSALFTTRYDGFAGLLGLPVPGLVLKLVQTGNKMEARFKGNNITSGYWRDKELTKKSFDEDGFYKTGDALRFVDTDNVSEGLLFNGRITEDFKLDTGTWVNVGSLRRRLIVTGNGLIHDVVITGHDQAFVGAILFLDKEICRRFLDVDKTVGLNELVGNEKLKDALQNIIDEMAMCSTGSANFIRRVMIADFELSQDKGELTDKGSVNQSNVIDNRKEYVDLIYDNTIIPNILDSRNAP